MKHDNRYYNVTNAIHHTLVRIQFEKTDFMSFYFARAYLEAITGFSGTPITIKINADDLTHFEYIVEFDLDYVVLK